MSPRVPVYAICMECKRRFGGEDALKRHRFSGRCLSDHQMRGRGIAKDSHDVYRRTQPEPTLPGIAQPGRPPRPPSAVPGSTESGARANLKGDPP